MWKRERKIETETGTEHSEERGIERETAGTNEPLFVWL